MVLLEVRADNEVAQGLYRRRGFAEIGRRPRLLPAQRGRTPCVMKRERALAGADVTASEPLVLGFETSCDETGVGLVRGHTLLADALATSMAEHERFGGVVPEIASRAHLEAMVPTVHRALADAGVTVDDVDAVAVTSGPGLTGALLVGVAAAKAYALALGKPLYGVNHLAAHVAVDELQHGPLAEPSIALLVSGGHSSLLLVPDLARDVESLGPHRRRRGGGGLRQGRPRARPAVPGRPADRQGRPRGRPARDRVPARADRARATRPTTSRSPG